MRAVDETTPETAAEDLKRTVDRVNGEISGILQRAGLAIDASFVVSRKGIVPILSLVPIEQSDTDGDS